MSISTQGIDVEPFAERFEAVISLLLPREIEFLELLAHGLSMNDIAHRLQVSFTSSYDRASRIAKKVGIPSSRNRGVEPREEILRKAYIHYKEGLARRGS